MPYAKPRRNRTRRTNRKPGGVRKRTYRKRTTLFRPQKILKVGFPKTTMVKLRYVDSIVIDPGVSTLATYAFRANSCFDPDFTGTGHQPMNFDMWATLYNHYTVVGSKIRCNFFGSIGSSKAVVSGINLSDDTTFTNDASTMMEQGLSRYHLAYENPVANKGNGSYVTKGYSCKKFFNLTNPTDNSDRIGAPVSTNPAELAYFIVFVGGLASSADDPSAYRINVMIDYVVVFSEPKEQPQS